MGALLRSRLSPEERCPHCSTAPYATRAQEAAAQGYGAAMNNLALLYLSGDHPAGRNVIEARKLFRKAAEEPSGTARIRGEKESERRQVFSEGEGLTQME